MIDHRPQQTVVRDQRDRGACVGFAVSYAHEWMTSSELLSPEDVLWAGHTQGGDPATEGTSVAFALAGLNQHGHAFEAAWPFGKPPWPASRPAAAAAAGGRRTLPRWRALGQPTTGEIQSTLEAGQAVLLSMKVVRSAWRDVSGLVDAPPGKVSRSGHAVLAVGVADGSSGRQVIFKNSWGADWGEAGYGFVTDRYLGAYLKTAFAVGPS